MAIENLKKYEMAVLASSLPDDKRFKRYAIPAMEDLYKQFGVAEDPAIQRMFFDTQVALNSGQGFSGEMAQAIAMYAKKYSKEIQSSTVGEYIGYATGKATIEIPDQVKALLDKYKEKKIEELDQENKEQEKVLAAISMIQRQVVEGNLLPKLISSSVKRETKKGLESLLQAE